ncbi:hypothetical protein CEXT_628761 [Caerostris extrusa]|uniref:Uncharacterized protein n=1 Tax=Caerostris extrusa TaxID=172846 RepID=A0AAV4U6W0_CAEEX|nr:hypothetical protein CEXT_628761 [Caerostris extrusa]
MRRMRFAGYICKMNASSLTFRIFNSIALGITTCGRPKLRWADCIEADFKVLRITNWKIIAKQRLEWKKIVGKTWLGSQ